MQPSKDQNSTNGIPTWKQNPDAALASALMQQSQSQKIADRLPDLKKSAYILLGLTLFAVFQTFAFKNVIVSMTGSQADAAGIITTFSIISWLITVVACIIVLSTRSIKLAKLILIIIGTCLIYYTISGLMSFDIIGTAINIFLIWWTYNLFDSVGALELKVN